MTHARDFRTGRRLNRLGLLAVAFSTLTLLVPAPATALDSILRDGVMGAALGCLFGHCTRKNVALGAAAGAVGFPVVRRVLGIGPAFGGSPAGYDVDYGDPCDNYPPGTLQRQKCEEGAARALQRDYEESVRQAERDGYCGVRPQDCGGSYRRWR